MNRLWLIFVVLFMGIDAFAQQVVLSGIVRDAGSGETLIGAVVSVEPGRQTASTNAYGFYSLTLPEGKHQVTFSYIGYQSYSEEIDLSSSQRLNVELRRGDNTLEEVVVSAERKDNNVSNPQMGVLNFTMEEVKNVPVVFGERDLLKTIQLLPGVQSAGEGTSNFYVRGGGGDQNLILLDEATVYNASHLLGFFSTFNSDAIKDVQLYKGGIPAQFGGRISSVLDIAMMDGNQKKLTTEGGIGLIASRLKVEAPLIKDKSSFMISGRRTYADMFLKLSNDEDVKKSKLYFYDLNAKLNFRFNDKNTLYLSGYFGKDDLGYSNLFNFDWGNATATVRWNHIFNDKLFSNTSLIYSDFSYNVQVSSDDSNFGIASKIRNWNFKQDFSYYQNPISTWRFGVHALQQSIYPASITAGENTSVNSVDVDSRQGIEAAAYVSHTWSPADWLSLLYGVRVNDFMVMGPGTFYTYDEDGEVIAEQFYNKGTVARHYLNIEPRFSASFLLSERHSIKASYNRIAQNLHQLTNTTASLPTDQYVVSSLNIKPQIADQVAVGYFRNFKDNRYEFSLETYYKYMDNQIDFRNGADLQANQYLEGDLLYGIGRSYGIEAYLRKSTGKLHGWISYTLARSERKFDEIDNGQWFRARQDRTHDVSVVSMYELSKKWTLGATFVYHTGNAVTFPSGKYEVDGKTMFYYTERNGYRMPNYHRLDLSATYEPVLSDKRFRSSWTFGVYNAYNRKNAYIIDFRENKNNTNITEAYKIALFGIIPSVTWNFKF
ncbi:TonB-dependent receptor [Sphingobacterium chuzhouense]|uniref:TonB-dependent receptor n=1 Tax=Sphingobacterium chuzhouense TaxID=1742264 RepID=A0ABR7XRZ5_9SPHI|nr:TonB-dependent receptor [Sphingobacterium chuzhouense]MBD1421923.1 TonB-dependent receptor [Sphingobacterium chuzhouense]